MQEQTYSMFSNELEEKIAERVIAIVTETAMEAKLEGNKRYFKKNAFCEEMSISFNSLQGWLRMGLPVIQVEGITMIDMQDAIEFLNKHKI